MVLPIFTANGGHLGFFDFYGSDFDRHFSGHSLCPVGEKTVEKPFVIIFWGSVGISTRLMGECLIQYHCI